MPEDAFRVLDVTMVGMVSPSDQGVCQKRLYITPATINPYFSLFISFADMYISSRIFENKPNEICSRLNVKRQKAGKTENRTNEGKRVENSNNEKKRKNK